MSGKRQFMLEAWNKWAAAVLPPQVSDLQRKEMRKAFYAGAEILYFEILISFSEGHEPTDDDVQLLDGVLKEIRQFNEQEGRIRLDFTSKSGKKL